MLPKNQIDKVAVGKISENQGKYQNNDQYDTKYDIGENKSSLMWPNNEKTWTDSMENIQYLKKFKNLGWNN